MLTIAYFTSRKEPMIHWFFRTLKRELRHCPVDLNIIVVDFCLGYHTIRFDNLQKVFEAELKGVDYVKSFMHVEPKPCAVQGRFKQTKNEHFAASNARNTAFALCRDEFIACVDDLSVLMPGWLPQVFHAWKHQYVMLGSYKKVRNLHADESGNVTYSNENIAVDSRWHIGRDSGIVPVGGSFLFGCSFALPIEDALRVNGFDEACDMQGAEDYDFGIRMDRAGSKIYYNRNALTIEDDLLHGAEGNQKFVRESVLMDFDGGKVMSDHVMLRKVTRERRTGTVQDDYNLRNLRQSLRIDGRFPNVTRVEDWRTGKPLSEI